MIKRIVERYCVKQAEIINQMQRENVVQCLSDDSYKNGLGYHKRKKKIMIATTKHNTAIDLFLRDLTHKKIKLDL